jgi:hypothetical protein
MLCNAWIGHTEKSRTDALCFRAAIDALGLKYATVAGWLGVNEKRFCRQLAGIEPLNHWRIAGLPDELRRAYIAQLSQQLGGQFFDADRLAILRGAATLGKRRMAKMFPDVFAERRRA